MAKPNMRELAEASGIKIDYSDPTTQQKLSEVSNALYGDVGANTDARDWDAIMKASNPLEAAKDALKVMYSDPEYLKANTEQLIGQGYVPEQADYTYRQMQDRVGSTYNPNWAAGSRFEGAIDTDGYLEKINSFGSDSQALEAYQNEQLAKWRGTGKVKSSTGLADMTNSANSVFNANAATNAGTFAPVNSGNTATAPGSTTGSPTTGTGLLTGSTTGSTTGSPTTGTGLISGADNLSGFRAMTPAQTNSAGLITSSMLTSPKAPTIQLPDGPTTPQTAPAGSWNFGSPQPAGAPQVKSGIVTWTNPATGQRLTYPAGTPSPGAGWVMG